MTKWVDRILPFFKKKEKPDLCCFVCDAPVVVETSATLQYRYAGGVESVYLCDGCAEKFGGKE